MKLKNKVAIAIIWSGLESWSNRFISVFVFLFLARLLGPKDFGLVATASVYIGFVGIFVDQGFSQAIIQNAKVDKSYLDTAFWINISFSFFLSVVSFFSASWISLFFQNQELLPIIQVLSFGFILGGVSQVQETLLTKELEFKLLSIRSFCASTLSGVVAITLALNGFGVWSLVVKELTFAVVRALSVWHLTEWRPGFSYSHQHASQLFKFGKNMIGIRLLNYLYRRSDDFLISYFLGPTALGIYTVGYRLLLMITELFIGIIQKVTLPTFSKLQDELPRLRSSFLKVTQLTALVCFPLFVSISIFSPEIINLMFGETWEASIPIMRILSFVGIVHSVTYFNSSVLIALGKPSHLFRIRIIQTLGSIIGFLIGLNWGIVGVSIAFVISNYCLAPLGIRPTLKEANICVSFYVNRYREALLSVMFSATVTLTTKFFVYAAFESVNSYFILFFLASLFMGSYVAMLRCLFPDLLKKNIFL